MPCSVPCRHRLRESGTLAGTQHTHTHTHRLNKQPYTQPTQPHLPALPRLAILEGQQELRHCGHVVSGPTRRRESLAAQPRLMRHQCPSCSRLLALCSSPLLPHSQWVSAVYATVALVVYTSLQDRLRVVASESSPSTRDARSAGRKSGSSLTQSCSLQKSVQHG